MGLNGAGKTTTLEILTGQKYSNSGQAFINGCDIESNCFKSHNSLGYCPQFDCLPEYLTVREAMILFSELRGISSYLTKRLVNDMVSIFQLNEFENSLVQNLR